MITYDVLLYHDESEDDVRVYVFTCLKRMTCVCVYIHPWLEALAELLT